MSHTQGTLTLSEDGIPELNNQCQILESEKGELIVYYQFKNKEDARRIAACWNAAIGIPTAELEAAADGRLLNIFEGLISERDDLLAALKKCNESAGSPEIVYLVSKNAIVGAEKGGA
jgi:hypothetical protein